MINHIYLLTGSFYQSIQQVAAPSQSTRHARKGVAFVACLLISIMLFGLTSQAVQAQAEGEPPLTIVGVETSHFPTIELTVDGADWPAARAAAPVQIFVNGEAQAILADRLTQQGISFLVAIDPNDLFTTGEAGQTRYIELTGALLDLIENEILLRGQDWMTAYLLQPTGVQSIQAWTQEPNLVFNSIVQNRPEELTGAPLAATTLINGLQQFTASPASAAQPRTLLLISAGADDLDVATVVATAQALAVQMHVVELVGSNNQSEAATPLAQLAQQTGGQYVALDAPTALPPLWERIASDHNRRILTFQSSVANPETIEAHLQLPTGATLRASAEPAAFAALSAGAAPAVQNVMTRSETQAPVTDALAVTAGAQSAAPQESTAPLPADEASGTAVDSLPSAIVIPGLQIALPRGLLQFSLPILLVLIAYFVYAEVRDRRKKRIAGKRAAHHRGADHRGAETYAAPDPLFSLDDNSQPLPANPFQLHERDTKAEPGFTVDTPPMRGMAPTSITPPPARPPARQSSFFRAEDEDDATMRPPRMEDDEATYRVQEVEQPILGYLVRTTSDPNLPKELPIYGLNPAPGEVRQIHIGRHSKHNTVVINDKSISREHAVIIQREGRLYLRDNASTSGTFLNWKRLNPGEELLLRHNDLLSFGQIVYEFRLYGEDEVTIAES